MKTRPAIAATAVALVLAGCSSPESKNDYVDTVNGIQSTVIEASSSLAAAPATSPKEAIKAFEKAETEVDEAVQELNEIDVPSEAEAGHADLVEGFEELAVLIADVRAQVEEGGGRAAFQELKTRGAEIDARIAKAIDEINADLGAEG